MSLCCCCNFRVEKALLCHAFTIVIVKFIDSDVCMYDAVMCGSGSYGNTEPFSPGKDYRREIHDCAYL
jgi:hypothetical protein